MVLWPCLRLDVHRLLRHMRLIRDLVHRLYCSLHHDLRLRRWYNLSYDMLLLLYWLRLLCQLMVWKVIRSWRPGRIRALIKDIVSVITGICVCIVGNGVIIGCSGTLSFWRSWFLAFCFNTIHLVTFQILDGILVDLFINQWLRSIVGVRRFGMMST